MKVLVAESETWLRDVLLGWLGEAGFEMVGCPGPEGPDFRSLDKPVVVLTGFEDTLRPLPGDRAAVLRRPPDREDVIRAVKVLLLGKELRPGPGLDTVPEVEAPGMGTADGPATELERGCTAGKGPPRDRENLVP